MCHRYGVQGFTGLEKMVKRGPVDAVWVCTPNNLHAEHTIRAAEYGKHVGSGVVFRQGPHQMDPVRYLAGGLVRSVRGLL